jgi:hypothetical protein
MENDTMKTKVIRVKTLLKWPVVVFRSGNSLCHHEMLYCRKNGKWNHSTGMRGWDYGQDEHRPEIITALNQWEKEAYEKRILEN